LPLRELRNEVEILERARAPFRRSLKPRHFTNYTHCKECQEHDDLLRKREANSLTIEDIGNPGWDPICYISPEGFEYYFPAFVRLTLSDSRMSYLSQLLFHLSYQGAKNRHFQHFSPKLRAEVAFVLRHLSENHPEIVDYLGCGEDLQKALSIWSR
jgi:hypothetical protein